VDQARRGAASFIIKGNRFPRRALTHIKPAASVSAHPPLSLRSAGWMTGPRRRAARSAAPPRAFLRRVRGAPCPYVPPPRRSPRQSPSWPGGEPFPATYLPPALPAPGSRPSGRAAGRRRRRTVLGTAPSAEQADPSKPASTAPQAEQRTPPWRPAKPWPATRRAGTKRGTSSRPLDRGSHRTGQPSSACTRPHLPLRALGPTPGPRAGPSVIVARASPSCVANRTECQCCSPPKKPV